MHFTTILCDPNRVNRHLKAIPVQTALYMLGLKFLEVLMNLLKPMIHGSTFVEQQMLNEGAATC